MQIAQALAGYTLGGADLLRRAMGKKKPEEMAKQKAAFVDGRQGERRRRRGRRAHLRPARELRRLRLQQEPLGRLRAHHLPDRLPEGALPGRAPLRDPHERQGRHREGRAHDRRRARDGHDRPAARRQRERHRLQGRLHAPCRRRKLPARADARVEGRARPADPLRPRRRARRRRRGARGGLRGARRGRPLRATSSTSRRASTPSASTRRVFEALVQCGAFDSTLAAARGDPRARVRVDRRRARALALREPRPRGRADRPLRPLRRGRPSRRRRPRRAPGDYVECEPWDRRETARARAPVARLLRLGPPARALRRRAARGSPSSERDADRRVRGDGRLGGREARRAWSRATASGSSRTAAARSRSSSSRT